MPDDVAWTPDGRTVAFAYQTNQQKLHQRNPAYPYLSADARVIQVFAADGSDWHFMQAIQSWAGPGLTFSQCNEAALRPGIWSRPWSPQHYRP